MLSQIRLHELRIFEYERDGAINLSKGANLRKILEYSFRRSSLPEGMYQACKRDSRPGYLVPLISVLNVWAYGWFCHRCLHFQFTINTKGCRAQSCALG